jgi:G:T-mismatch repair DNA endonuclease (very short patch repair protein)
VFQRLLVFLWGGGLDLGFKQAGFRLLAASDNEPAAEKTHRANWPDVPFILSLRKQGWKVLVIWECEVAKEVQLAKRIRRFLG